MGEQPDASAEAHSISDRAVDGPAAALPRTPQEGAMHQDPFSAISGLRRATAVAGIGFLVLMAVTVAVVSVWPSTAAAVPASKQTAQPVSPPKVKAPPPRSKSPSRAKRGSSSPIARAALCSAPMVGDWRNINASTNAMTRALVSFRCSDQILCDTNGNCTGGDSYYSVQMFGRCHPADCDWGRVRASDMSDGWIRAMYYFGFKTSHVWLKTYSYYGLTYLRVWVANDFASWDGRSDYTTDEWFLR
jgi:hypothetical protein